MQQNHILLFSRRRRHDQLLPHMRLENEGAHPQCNKTEACTARRRGCSRHSFSFRQPELCSGAMCQTKGSILGFGGSGEISDLLSAGTVVDVPGLVSRCLVLGVGEAFMLLCSTTVMPPVVEEVLHQLCFCTVSTITPSARTEGFEPFSRKGYPPASKLTLVPLTLARALDLDPPVSTEPPQLPVEVL